VFDPKTVELATRVLSSCRARGWHVATAVSCMGGLTAEALRYAGAPAPSGAGLP
jgi:nicotinamide mononucleotide (NMN) deamidase PncC